MRSRLKRKFENLIENTWYGPEKKKKTVSRYLNAERRIYIVFNVFGLSLVYAVFK